ncbi:HNH endonuclease [Corticibacter populi]|uniref:HNH endonuclease n=1 Tax=Corticibacter populi TaxID=1550736 RepID=A0A3M6QUM0_9BURK|nr:HNH endonuclease signature motif containing protein [Corticibacter populi]RMX06724.1 HNH endonuclease [Corticibacter populi]RZS31695.1 5-methylcytosine-specific restriction protein A [Corticibacter populi]
MASAAPRPCSHPGCGVLVYDGSGRCPKHPRKTWAKRPAAPKRITGRALQRLRAELFAREPLCRACNAKALVTLATQRDHIIPLEEGGADTDDNIQPLCSACHDAKSKAERARGVRRHWDAYREG